MSVHDQLELAFTFHWNTHPASSGAVRAWISLRVVVAALIRSAKRGSAARICTASLAQCRPGELETEVLKGGGALRLVGDGVPDPPLPATGLGVPPQEQPSLLGLISGELARRRGLLGLQFPRLQDTSRDRAVVAFLARLSGQRAVGGRCHDYAA